MREKINLEKELKKFHLSSDGVVEFYQIDALQVLYNIQYLYIFENSRLAYMRKLGFVEKIDDLRTKFSVLTVHHSIDYFNPGFTVMNILFIVEFLKLKLHHSHLKTL